MFGEAESKLSIFTQTYHTSIEGLGGGGGGGKEERVRDTKYSLCPCVG